MRSYLLCSEDNLYMRRGKFEARPEKAPSQLEEKAVTKAAAAARAEAAWAEAAAEEENQEKAGAFLSIENGRTRPTSA